MYYIYIVVFILVQYMYRVKATVIEIAKLSLNQRHVFILEIQCNYCMWGIEIKSTDRLHNQRNDEQNTVFAIFSFTHCMYMCYIFSYNLCFIVICIVVAKQLITE